MPGAWDGTLAAIIGGFAGALAGIAATTFTNKSNRTAARVEKRIDDIENAVELLRVEAISYWASDGNGDSASSRKIISLWETLGCRVTALGSFQDQVGDVSEVEQCVDSLYDIITGDDFQSKTRAADSNKVTKIRKHCQDLCDHLHTSRSLVNRWRHFWKRRSAK